jgi:hypothetical protein
LYLESRKIFDMLAALVGTLFIEAN